MQFWKTALCLFAIWCSSLFGVLLLLFKTEYIRVVSRENSLTDVPELKTEWLASKNNKSRISHKPMQLQPPDLLEIARNDCCSPPTEATVSVTGQTKERRCEETRSVAFLKSHKTGSSTVTNIINRFADLRELVIALPAMGMVRFDWPRRFHWTSVDLLRLDGRPANVLCNHARYDREQLELIMDNNTKYVTIIRDPTTQFESAFYYFDMDAELGLRSQQNAIEYFLQTPEEYLLNVTELRGDLPQILNLIQSGMTYDLGFDFLDLEEDEVIEKAMQSLNDQFSLVMLQEYFDESLVLLARELCWNFDDILYIKQNERTNTHKLSPETKEKIRRWNRADTALYMHFNRTFWSKVSKYGENFWNDVAEFKRMNRRFQDTCSASNVSGKGYMSNEFVSHFILNPKIERFHKYFCQKSLKTEVEYLQYFRKKFGTQYYNYYRKVLLDEGLREKDTGTGELQKRLNNYKRGVSISVPRAI